MSRPPDPVHNPSGRSIHSRFIVRDIEDIGDAALSYAEVKALAARAPG